MRRTALLALLPLLLLAAPAGAVTITAADVGSSFHVDFVGNVNGVNLAGLTAAADFSVVAFTGSQLVLDITLTNNTSPTLFTDSRVSAIGFDVDVALSGASASGLFSYANLGGQFPNGFGAVDVCAIQNKNNCSGGANGGVSLGQSGTVRLTLDFAPAKGIDLSNFGVRFQSIDLASTAWDDDLSGTGRPGVSPPIPEPAAALVFGLGAVLVGGARRRRA